MFDLFSSFHRAHQITHQYPCSGFDFTEILGPEISVVSEAARGGDFVAIRAGASGGRLATDHWWNGDFLDWADWVDWWIYFAFGWCADEEMGSAGLLRRGRNTENM
jgi:hypothetical protein